MRLAIRRHLRDFVAVAALMVAGLATAVYVLGHQRLRFPLIEGAPFHVDAEFSSAQAVMPGQGQTVRVSGVRVGDIGKVRLRDGVAVVTMDLDPQYRDLVHRDATALLRPKTGLKDMFIELDPGSDRAPLVKDGFTIGVGRTQPDVSPDEVLSMLDSDTRQYLQLLVQGTGEGLRGRGGELREVYRRFEPTSRDLARVTRRVASRQRSLRRVVHALRQLSGELAGHDEQLAGLVSSSSQVFRALASEDAGVSRSVELLPAALRDTTAALGQVRRLALALGPAATRLRPAARHLAGLDRALEPLGREATPVVRRDLRPFVREARPLVRAARPAARDLAEATPQVTRTGTVVNHLLNLLGYNPKGREGPGVPDRQEGMLYWLAWLDHDADAIFATADAHGPFRPLAEQATCATMMGLAQALGRGDPLTGIALQGWQGIFTDPRVCGSAPEGARVRREAAR
jgi:phospholipid/cholesterol/gamma-HCH transport system substrate-binding protein